MKKAVAIMSFIVLASSACVMTSCGPGHKSTYPDNTTDSLGTPYNNNNSNMNMDSTMSLDTNHRNPAPLRK